MPESFDGLRVLFVCVANSARSPMAEKLAPGLLGAGVVATSAGARPTEEAHPYAVEVMREAGYDISAHVPRAIADVDPKSIDLVVRLCDDDVVPASFVAVPQVTARISDPALHAMEFSRAMALEGFRSAREDIEDALRDLALKGPPRP